MKSDLCREYLQLLQDTRLFIQNQLRPAPLYESPPPPPSPPTSLPSYQPEKKKEVKEKSTREVSKLPETEGAKPKIRVTWELHPMAPVEGSGTFHHKLSPYVKICEPLISTLLLLPEENGAHRLFLENVARVITRTFSAATVLLYQEKLFYTGQNKILLAPITLLKRVFPEVEEPHKIFKAETFTLIPLEPLDHYAHDMNCKRILWNTIQHLFQSLSTKGGTAP
jgi:hypothetical protein